MAELGATVISFLSLVKVIKAVHSGLATLQNAPIEIRFLQDQLRSLDFILGQVALMQKENGGSLRPKGFNESLARVEKPLRQDIEALETLVQSITHKGKNIDGDNIAASAKLKFMYKSGQLEQITRRLGVHRDQLNTVLLVGQSHYLTHHDDLLTKACSVATNVERITISIQQSINSPDQTRVGRFHPQYDIGGICQAQLQDALQTLTREQQIYRHSSDAQFAALNEILSKMARSSPVPPFEARWGDQPISFQAFTRLDFDFGLGRVIISWGPRRSNRRRKRPGDTFRSAGPSPIDIVPPNTSHGWLVQLEIVPATWLSSRAVISGWTFIPDQRSSSLVNHSLSFPMTVPAKADVMNFAAVNNVIGLKTLFENRMASVTDRTAAGWTPLHIAAASGHTDSCRYLLTHAADVTSMGRAGLTPSHLAAMYGHLDVLKALFEFDADPECRNQHGFNVIFEVLHSPFIEQPSAKMMIVKWILEQDWFVIDVNGQDYQGNSILGWFAQHYTNGVKLLLGHGAAVNTRSSDGITPLHRAAAVGSLESVGLLIDHGADLGAIENDGSTALVRASEQGYGNVVKLLMASGTKPANTGGKPPGAHLTYKPVPLICAKNTPGPSKVVNQIIRACSRLNEQDRQENLEIWQAVEQGYWAVVNQLQGAGVDPDRKDEYGYRALIRLAYQEDWIKLNELLIRGRSPTTLDDFSLSLTRAAAGGHDQIVAHLISAVQPGFYDDGLGTNALIAASRYGHFEIVKMLVHLVPKRFWYNALLRSAEKGYIDIVNFFLDQGIHPARQVAGGDTAIVRAARYGHLGIVKRLLEAGADPNEHGWFGYSALVRASYNGFLEVVDCLLNALALPDLPEIGGDRAIVRAARQGHFQVVDRLLKAGALPTPDSYVNKDDVSKGLMKAAIYNDEPTMLSLLNNGANPNSVERDGSTPLSRAAENGHTNIVSILLQHNAVVHASSDKMISPLEKAAQGGFLDIVRLILEKGMKIPLVDLQRAAAAASEAGHTEISAFLIQNGVELRPASSVGLVHFNIVDYWVKDMKPPEMKIPDCESQQDAVPQDKILKYPTEVPTWGYDGSLVVKFQWPFKISFSSDLMSSRTRQVVSTVLINIQWIAQLLRFAVFWLIALLGLAIGLTLLGVESLVRLTSIVSWQ